MVAVAVLAAMVGSELRPRRGTKVQTDLGRISVIWAVVWATALYPVSRYGDIGAVTLTVFWVGTFLSWFGVRSHIESSILLRMVYLLRRQPMTESQLVERYSSVYGQAKRVEELLRGDMATKSEGRLSVTAKGRTILGVVARFQGASRGAHRPDIPVPETTMREPGPEPELVRIERTLTACLIVLKLHVLYLAWGNMQGFDSGPWIDVFRATHWFAPLPAARALFSSYHPPLSFLICRWIFAAYPHEVEASQILSTLAAIGTVFALRSTLRTLGILWTLPGMALLYIATSLPVVVWMGIETTYDTLVLAWFATTLAISVELFWNPIPAGWWRRAHTAAGPVLLGLVLAAGMLTKSSAVLFLGVPYLIIVVRRGPRALFHELGASSLAVLLGVALVAPLYYTQYYVPLGHLFPSNMDWLRADDLPRVRAERDAHPWRFLIRLLRIPGDSLAGERDPERDSFVYSVWQQLWKRCRALGGQQQAGLSLAVSDFYIRAMGIPIVVSTILLVTERRRLNAVWRHLGIVLFVVFLVFTVALLSFGCKYPLWDWHPFKAKYMSPAFLWIAYCAVVPFVNRSRAPIDVAWRWYGAARDVASLFVLLFMFVNHLLPVY